MMTLGEALGWIARPLAHLTALIMMCCFLFFAPECELDTAKFNRTAEEGTPQRNIIEALVAMRDRELDADSWVGVICHPRACGKFARFSREHITPNLDFTPDCLIEGEKIEIKPAGGRPVEFGAYERLFWVRCKKANAWLEVEFHPRSKTNPEGKPYIVWLIASMRRVEEVPEGDAP